jgi:DNA-binding MarR family transcriptional regulator
MAKSTKPVSFRLETHPFFWFGQIFGLRNRALNRKLRPIDLDYQRMKVLACLEEFPGCSMQQLADFTVVDRTSLTHTVQLLVNKGLVQRQARAADRRSVALALTPTGRKAVKKISPMILRLNDVSMAGFTSKEKQELLDQLRRMVQNLKDFETAG